MFENHVVCAVPIVASRWRVRVVQRHNGQRHDPLEPSANRRAVTPHRRAKVLLHGGSAARYLPSGHLVYAVGETLFAAPFDAGRLQLSGDAIPIVEGMMRAESAATTSGTANFSVSNDGTLVYATGGGVVLPVGTLVWVDRNGKAEALSDRQATYLAPRVSPDGARVAVAMRSPDANEDIWVVDAARGTHTRLTSDPAVDTVPVWTPDGRRIAFSSQRGGGANSLYWMAADGSGTAEPLTKASTNQGATSWLADGTTLAFYDAGGRYDIFTVKPPAAPVQLFDTPSREDSPAFSPDGRWLAFSSDETTQPEIYVSPYPGSGGRIAISKGGGRSPRWSPDGRHLFYRNGRQMMIVAIEFGPTLRAGTPHLLFEGDYMQELEQMGAHNYDISPDGTRFVMVAPVATAGSEQVRPRLVVVQNWLAELKRRVPVN